MSALFWLKIVWSVIIFLLGLLIAGVVISKDWFNNIIKIAFPTLLIFCMGVVLVLIWGHL